MIKLRHIILAATLLPAFLVSAGFHAYAIWVGLGFVRGLAMAGLTLAYFVSQGIVMALERALGVRTWSPFAGHDQHRFQNPGEVLFTVMLGLGFVVCVVRVLRDRNSALVQHHGVCAVAGQFR